MSDENIVFRIMEEDDLDEVLDIIELHDDDDAEEAEGEYQEMGINGQYVMELNGRIIGVTGARRIDATDETFKLSWTYVDKNLCSRGYGRQMLEHLLTRVTECGGRKIFVYVSDYVDEDGNSIYAAALALYQSLGFVSEVTIYDYYDKGEALTVLGYPLKQANENPTYKTESPKIIFDELFPLAETENTFSFSWNTKLFGKSFTSEDVKIGTDAAMDVKADLLLISFPSNFDNVSIPLFEAGFSSAGQLKDYYENGVHEDIYCYRL